MTTAEAQTQFPAGTRVRFSLKRCDGTMRDDEGVVRCVWEYDGRPIIDVESGIVRNSVHVRFGDRIEVIGT